MKIGRIKPRWTLSGLMVMIAVVALPLAWYSYRAREMARQRAVADSRRSKIEAQIKQILEAMEGQQKPEQDFVSGEIARVKPPAKPPDGSIPERPTAPPATTEEQPR